MKDESSFQFDEDEEDTGRSLCSQEVQEKHAKGYKSLRLFVLPVKMEEEIGIFRRLYARCSSSQIFTRRANGRVPC
jgi:hypothetical protein